MKIFTGRPVFVPERARATFKKSRVLEKRGRVDEAARERSASFQMLSELTDLDGRTVADITDSDFDEVICFWSR